MWHWSKSLKSCVKGEVEEWLRLVLGFVVERGFGSVVEKAAA